MIHVGINVLEDMSENSESEQRHRGTLTDKYQDRTQTNMSGEDNSVSNCDTRDATSGLASPSLSPTRKNTGESNELEITRRSRQPFLTPGTTVLILLGLISSLLMANMYLDSHEMIKYEKELGELRLQLLQKELELKDLQAEIAQQNNRLLNEHGKTVEEVNKKLDDVAGKYEKENNDLKAKNEELVLTVARRKNFYMKENGDSELHLAAYWRDEKGVKQLVEKGADLNARNNLLETPLYRAAVGKDTMMGLRIIKYLIANGADVALADYRRFTFLHQLVDSGTTITPLQFHDISAFLIGKKLTKLFDATESIYESTPLHLAVRDLEVEQRTLSLLYKNGVNFRAVNKMGNSLLTYAAEGRRSLQFLTNLIKFGQDWMHLNKANQSLLHITAEFGNEEALQFFMQKGGLDVNAKDVEGNTPMHIAVLRSLRIVSVVEAVRILIQSGANLKITNKMGVTPLQIVLKREDIPDKFKVTELLIKNER